MSDDQPSSATVHPAERMTMENWERTVRKLMEKHKLQRLRPTRSDPQKDPTAQKMWEPDTADFCAMKPQLRHCSEDEFVEVGFASSPTDATQHRESRETAFVGLVPQERGEVRVNTLKATEKRMLCRALQSDIGSFMKHAAVQAATRESVHPKALTYEMDDHTKTTLFEGSIGSLGYRRCAAGSEIHCITDSHDGVVNQLFLTVARSERMSV